MKFKYTLAFAIHGLTSNSLGEFVNPIVTDRPDVSVVLVKDADVLLSIIDRGRAFASLMLRSFFGDPTEGDRTELLREEVVKIRSRRKKRAKGAATLVIDITGETEVDLSGVQREMDDFVVIFDAVDKESLRSQHARLVSSIVASLALSIPRIEPIEKLRDGIYLLDSNGKVYLSLTLSTGTPSVRVSSPLTPEMLAAARFYREGLLKRQNIATVVRFFNQSIDKSSDTLRSFLFAWTGLEILINKTFSLHALDSYHDCVSDVTSDKFSLLDKFNIVSHFLGQSSSQADSKQFQEIKKTRDRFLHGDDIPESDLPVHGTQNLLQRYLIKYLRLRND
ncbi:MAG: hypothetical protein ABII79_14345 [bacterium]